MGLPDEMPGVKLEERERPQHRVLISQAFEMGKHEVTQAQWEAVMDSNPSVFKGRELPVMIALSIFCMPPTFSGIELPAWLGLAYVSLFSMLIGFVFWYRGLAQGGIAAVGQLQLLQPFFGLALAATLLHEPVTWMMLAVTVAVILCVAGARRFAR